VLPIQPSETFMSNHHLPHHSPSSHSTLGLHAPRVDANLNPRISGAADARAAFQGQIPGAKRSNSHSDLGARLLSWDPQNNPRRLVPQLALVSSGTRRDLLEETAHSRNPRRLQALEAILMSSGSMRELSSLMKRIPAQDRGSSRLAALHLKTIMLEACQPLSSLREANPRTLEGTTKVRDALILSFSLICKGQLEFGHSAPPLARRAFLQFSRALLNELSHFPSAKSRDVTTGAYVYHLIARAEIFRKYGVMMLNGRDLVAREKALWNLHEVTEITRALKHIPKWALIGTPLLCSIIRRSGCADDFYACRTRSGDIEIYSRAFSNYESAPYLKGWSSQQVCLVHEICHGLHFGDRYNLKLAPDGTIRQSGNISVSFERFAALSDWRVVEGTPQLRRQHHYALVRGIEVPLDLPITLHPNERIQFSFDPYAPNAQPLWSHNPDAGFAFGPNAHRSPWEDYADSGTMYFLTPAIFQKLAPAKFAYFESIYRMYPNGVPSAREIVPDNGYLNPVALQEALGRHGPSRAPRKPLT
jgi:hypothetical protein